MTDKFWVTGGNGNWSDTGNWSLTTGGSSGTAIPTASDDVFLDDMSGSGTVLVDSGATRTARSLICTGFTGTLQMGGTGSSTTLTISGEVLFVAAMTLTDGTIGVETNRMDFIDDIGGPNMTSGGKTVPWETRWFSTIASIKTLQDDWVCTGRVRFHPAADNDNMTCNGFSIEVQGADCYAGSSSGDTLGTTLIKLTGTGTLYLNTLTTDAFRLDIEFTSGTRTVRGDGGVSDATWTYVAGTLIFADEDDVDPCYLNIASSTGTFKLDLGTGAYTIPRVYMRLTNTSIEITNTGGNLTIADFRVPSSVITTITNLQTNALLIDKWNSADKTLANMGNQTYVGPISFGEFYCEFVTTDSTFTFDSTAIYTFREQFEVLKLDDGKEHFTSDHGTNKVVFHIWHACRTHLYGINATRIDALWTGQAMDIQGASNITECLGVYPELSNKAIRGLSGSVPTLTRVVHEYYQDALKDPVTISGTVELSATPQANALVLVVTSATENGKQWFKLTDVLVTDAQGEWQTNVPSGVEVFIEVHYDTGAQKYNSLTKPFIAST